MYMTRNMKDEQLPVLIEILHRLPEDCYFSIAESGDCNNQLEVLLQAQTQEQVKRWRALLPRSTWSKEPHASLKWWEYKTDYHGVAVTIYGCMEAPPTCRLERRVEIVKEQVPVAFETKNVEREVIEWKCDGEEVEA